MTNPTTTRTAYQPGHVVKLIERDDDGAVVIPMATATVLADDGGDHLSVTLVDRPNVTLWLVTALDVTAPRFEIRWTCSDVWQLWDRLDRSAVVEAASLVDVGLAAALLEDAWDHTWTDDDRADDEFTLAAMTELLGEFLPDLF